MYELSTQITTWTGTVAVCIGAGTGAFGSHFIELGGLEGMKRFFVVGRRLPHFSSPSFPLEANFVSLPSCSTSPTERTPYRPRSSSSRY